MLWNACRRFGAGVALLTNQNNPSDDFCLKVSAASHDNMFPNSVSQHGHEHLSSSFYIFIIKSTNINIIIINIMAATM